MKESEQEGDLERREQNLKEKAAALEKEKEDLKKREQQAFKAQQEALKAQAAALKEREAVLNAREQVLKQNETLVSKESQSKSEEGFISKNPLTSAFIGVFVVAVALSGPPGLAIVAAGCLAYGAKTMYDESKNQEIQNRPQIQPAMTSGVRKDNSRENPPGPSKEQEGRWWGDDMSRTKQQNTTQDEQKAEKSVQNPQDLQQQNQRQSSVPVQVAIPVEIEIPIAYAVKEMAKKVKNQQQSSVLMDEHCNAAAIKIQANIRRFIQTRSGVDNKHRTSVTSLSSHSSKSNKKNDAELFQF